MSTGTGTAIRLSWGDIPARVRESVELSLGGPAVRAETQGSGFSYGVAARLAFANGSRAFIKAIPAGDELSVRYRTEGEKARVLAPSIAFMPRVLFMDEDLHGWTVLAFEDIEGHPPVPSKPAELLAAIDTMTLIPGNITPHLKRMLPPIEEVFLANRRAWQLFATNGIPPGLDSRCHRHVGRLVEMESGWAAACQGDALLHGDLFPHNMLYTPSGEVVIVDWERACVGAPWVDLVMFLAVTSDSLDPEAIVHSNPLTREVSPADINCMLAAYLGHWAWSSQQPVQPTRPNLRKFHTRCTAMTLEWLSRRIGLD